MVDTSKTRADPREWPEPSDQDVPDNLKFPDADLNKQYCEMGIKDIYISDAKDGLHTSIRRGDTATATICAAILLASHHVANLFTNLLHIASEDIGPADDSVLRATVRGYEWYASLRCRDRYALKWQWKRLRNVRGIRDIVDGLVRMMCAAPKSRVCAHACSGVVGPILDGPDAVGRGNWVEDMEACVGRRDAVGAFENLARALRTDRDTGRYEHPSLKKVMAFLRDRGQTYALRAAVAIAPPKELRAKVPIVQLIHGLFSATHMESDRDASPISDPAAVDSIYGRLLGPETQWDLHIHTDYLNSYQSCRGATRALVESEHAALIPRVDPTKVAFPEIDMYDRAGIGAAVTEIAKKRRKGSNQ